MGKFYIKPSDESENGIVKLEYDKNNIIHLDDTKLVLIFLRMLLCVM